MPLYNYINDETGEVIEVLQTMGEPHEYVVGGVPWRRLFTAPQIAMDIKVDPFNSRAYLEKTKNPGTIGDLWDRAAELSAMREEKSGGTDPVVEKYVKETGKKLPPKKPKDQTIYLG